jgi:hypothetical protein
MMAIMRIADRMADQKLGFGGLSEGDIFHAAAPNGASLICLVTETTASRICARAITTQISLEFDRQTGVAAWGPEKTPCTIDSTAPLPAETHAVFVRLDQRYRSTDRLEDLKLLEVEKRALVFAGSYYSVHLL